MWSLWVYLKNRRNISDKFKKNLPDKQREREKTICTTAVAITEMGKKIQTVLNVKTFLDHINANIKLNPECTFCTAFKIFFVALLLHHLGKK